MPRKKATPDANLSTNTTTDQIEILPIPAVSKTAITKARDLALAIIAETTALAVNLVVDTEEQYHAADEILHKIKVTGKRLDVPFDEVIKPVRGGLDKVYSLRRSIENPLLDLETTVKEKMRVYKINEAQRLNEERQERERLQAVAENEERLRLAAQAPFQHPVGCPCGTCDGRGSVVSATPLFTMPPPATAPEVFALPLVPPAQPVRAASSSATKVKKVRIYDMSLFIQGVTLGMTPEDLLQVDWSALNARVKNDPDTVATYPGVEIYDDFTISGR